MRKFILPAVFVLGLTHFCFATNDLCVEPTEEKQTMIENQRVMEKDDLKKSEYMEITDIAENRLKIIEKLGKGMKPLLERIPNPPIDTGDLEKAIGDVKDSYKALIDKIQELTQNITARDQKIAELEEKIKELSRKND